MNTINMIAVAIVFSLFGLIMGIFMAESVNIAENYVCNDLLNDTCNTCNSVISYSNNLTDVLNRHGYNLSHLSYLSCD